MFRPIRILGALFLGLACMAALADGKVPATPVAPDFSKGMLCGKVLDTATGKPVPNATVALADKDGKVVAWTKTDAEGKYSLAADSLKVLNLRPSHRRGLLEEVARGAGQLVTIPVKVAGTVVETIRKTSPVETVKNAAISAATGNPVPIGAQVVNTVAGTAGQTKATAENQTKEMAVRTAFGERLNDKNQKKSALAPGEVFIAVSRPEYKEVKGKAGTYWLEAAIPPVKDQKNKKEDKGRGVCAWMETVKLAPATAADKKSEILNEAILLSEPKIEPTLIPIGGTAKISVKLLAPMNPVAKLRVFAREDKKRTILELKPQANNLYTGELTIDSNCPSGDTKITIAALREEPIEVKLPKSKDDPLLLFAKRLDDLEPGKPFEYDPRILASENRLDITVTVLDPRQQTPAGSPKPPDVKK